ncbi:MAG TPA: fused MFS/spermidine synthase [Hymenobacter sp.]|nr:fused MFS/spermidine synthase [Hymenobacter sp.]
MLHRLRRLLSYVRPLTRTVHSAVNGPLEITWQNGRKVLDARHANYSYGSLQQVLRYGLLYTEVPRTAPVLLLGLGGGSVVQTLRHEQQHAGPITAIELDPIVVELADVEFNIRPDAALNIICADAFAWLPTAADAAFELIIIDLFIDLHLPAGLCTTGFWEAVRRVLRPDGYVLFNTLTNATLDIAGEELSVYLQRHGMVVKELEVEQLNRLLILRKR